MDRTSPLILGARIAGLVPLLSMIIYAWGWPRWIESNPDGFASMASTIVMLIGAGLAWSALPGLAELEKKWRGGR